MMIRKVLVFAVLLTSATYAAYSQESNIVRKELSQAEISRIIKKVSENESAFREALKDYVFTRKAAVSCTVGMAYQIERSAGSHS